MMAIHLFNMDCNEGMKDYPDKFWDLSCIDPPYGLSERMVQGGTWAKNRKKEYSGWDKKPSEDFFKQLFRVSQNQIIWGGNYFELPPTRGFIVWDKPSMRISTMSDCEYAWTSFDCPAKIIKVNQEKGDIRISLSQKPVKLYKWLLKNYAKPGDKILDTHGGSMSIAIACHDMGFDLWCYELDPDYFKAAKERLERHQQQLKLFLDK
jgi:site-specific DNA-methyltransferase (adenine-specific)